MTVHEIFTLLDGYAPVKLQMDFDNAGFLVGEAAQTVSKVLIALDITEEVVREAAETGAQLIVSHHPVIFHPLRSVTDQDPTGRTVRALIQNRISAVCMHTNLDLVRNGVNDALARALGLEETDILEPGGEDDWDEPFGLGRIGFWMEGPKPLSDFIYHVKTALGTPGVRCHDAGVPVHKVAVGGGACGSSMLTAKAQNCDTFVTADLKYNDFLDARAIGINLIDAGHFPTENVICEPLAEFLAASCPELTVEISSRHGDVVQFR